MPVVGTQALTELWAKVKENFGRALAVSAASTTVDVKLNNASGTTLGTGTIPAATQSAAGLLTAADKAKLDGIAEGATATNDNTTYSISKAGSTVTLTGSDGATSTFEDSDTTYVAATEDSDGLMTTSQVAKLAGIEEGATKVTVDAELTAGGENPVQGKAVQTALDLKADLASPALTGAPTAPTAAAGTNTTQVATTAFVTTAVSAAKVGVATFQGTLDSADTLESASYTAGMYWLVTTAGTYAGQACEVGDMVFAVADEGGAYTAADFAVIQANVQEMTPVEVDAICV